MRSNDTVRPEYPRSRASPSLTLGNHESIKESAAQPHLRRPQKLNVRKVDALHLWSAIAGQYRLKFQPFLGPDCDRTLFYHGSSERQSVVPNACNVRAHNSS